MIESKTHKHNFTEGLQYGQSANISVPGYGSTASVLTTFPVAYAAPPIVVISGNMQGTASGNNTNIRGYFQVYVSNVTANNFRTYLYNTGDTAGTASIRVNWMAIPATN